MRIFRARPRLLLLLCVLTCLGLCSAAATAAPLAADSFFGHFFKVYMPRHMCMFEESGVIWLHVISDAIIMLAYYSIPIALIYFVRRRPDFKLGWLLWCFAAFILACGTTHLMNILAMWYPIYRVDGVVKLFTALISIATAIALWPLIPKALRIPSPVELQAANESLIHEVAERVRAEEALRKAHAELEDRVQQRTAELVATRANAAEARARLGSIVESSEDAIISLNLDGHITTWNHAAQRLFGYTAAETLGRSIQMIIPPDRRREDEDILDQLRRGLRADNFETIRLAKDGRRLDISLTISPIRDEHGEIVGTSKIARDVTAQRQVREEREHLLASERAARAEADRSSRIKDEFLAMLSHELRTPLNAIVGWTQILHRGNAAAADVKEGLEVIDRSARAQAQLIDELLDMSRIMSGKVRLDVQPVDLSGVIEAAVSSMRPAAEAKDIRLQVVVDPAAGPVTGDPSRLQQVFWNLLNNAIKFTPKGGRVQLRAERINSHVEVTCTDTGAGIEPELLPHVFERFRQGDTSITRRHGGLGLGLAIVKHLIELHGGTVRAASAGKDQGAAFMIILPVRATHQPPTAAHLAPPSPAPPAPGILPQLAGLKVLVVDDDADSRDLVRRILEAQRAGVITAASAAEGYERARAHRPDLLISDIGMPEEDGYSMLRRIRGLTLAEGGSIPAVALTAYARPEERRKALLSGYQVHLAKPVDATELVLVAYNLTVRK